MPRIDQMFAFIAEDQGPDDEGLAAFNSGMGWMPMVCGDPARVESMRKMARTISKTTGQRIKLVKFTLREELEVFTPEGGNGHGN